MKVLGRFLLVMSFCLTVASFFFIFVEFFIRALLTVTVTPLIYIFTGANVYFINDTSIIFKSCLDLSDYISRKFKLND